MNLNKTFCHLCASRKLLMYDEGLPHPLFLVKKQVFHGRLDYNGAYQLENLVCGVLFRVVSQWRLSDYMQQCKLTSFFSLV